MTSPNYNPPPPVPGGFRLSEHVGELVYVYVQSFIPDYPSQYGTRDTVRIDVEVVAGRLPGERGVNQLASNGMLVAQLRDSVGRDMYARIAAKQGNNANPAIYLAEPSAEDAPLVAAHQARRAGAVIQQQPPVVQQPMPMTVMTGGLPGGLSPTMPPVAPPVGFGQPPIEPPF